MTTIPLETPQQQSLSSFLTDAKQVAQWLDGLPMANLSDSARQVFKALMALNHLQMVMIERKKRLDLFAEPVHFIIAGLKRRYMGRAFPLSDKSRKIAQLVTEFDLQMAIAYKILVQELLRSSPSVFKTHKKLLPEFIYQAIYHLTQALLHSGEVYAQAPPKVWLDLHGLYRIAEQQQCLTTKPAGKPLSIDALYQQTLLFAIVVRDRLPQQDISPILELLAEFTPYSRLYAYHPRVNYERTLFLVSPYQDHGPQHLLFAEPVPVQESWVLDAHDALTEVMARLARQEAEAQPTYAAQHLQWLKQAWQPAREHQSPRVRRERALLAALGLNAIYDLLQSQQVAAEAHLLSREPEALQDPDSLMFAALHEVTLSLAPQELSMGGGSDAATWGRTASSYLDQEPPLNIWAQEALSQNFEQYQCFSLNESNEGYCLQWPQAHPEKLQIGLLMALHSVERNQGQPEIGIIRWIHGAANGSIQVGIEKLAMQALAILSRPKPPAPASRKTSKAKANVLMDNPPFTKALLLPGSAESYPEDRLITPALPYQQGQTVELKDQTSGEVRVVQLSQQLGHNALFSCFRFIDLAQSGTVPMATPTNTIQTDGTPNGDDYEVIWSQL